MAPEERPQVESFDLALAAELQAALLPNECPTDYPHLLAAARNRMCTSVGGDFYDFIRINEEQIAIYVGDVVGHGVRASLIVAQIMGFLRSRPVSLARPSKLIIALNDILIDLGERIGGVVPCTMFYAVIDAPTGIAFFVNCGHPRPFLGDREGSEPLPLGPQNLLLGVEGFAPAEGCHTFTPGQRLVMYTDGLTDAAGDDDARFGVERLCEAINAQTKSNPQQCTDAIFQAVDEFRGNAAQIDDETIVVIDRV